MSNILSLPLEMFEKIVSAVGFVDLPHFLQTSKTIKVFKSVCRKFDLIRRSLIFKRQKYHHQLALIPPEVLKDTYEDFVQHPRSWSHWSTHNILLALSSPYCEEVSILLFFH
jgi:hypothetical protein